MTTEDAAILVDLLEQSTDRMTVSTLSESVAKIVAACAIFE